MSLDNTMPLPWRAPNTCTCGSCPVHGSQVPRCPACGAVGAHLCPGPSYPGVKPHIYSTEANTLKRCDKGHFYSGDAHICSGGSGTVYVQRDTPTS